MPLVIINGAIVSDCDELGSWGAPTALTIASGVITVTGPGFYEIDTETAAATDDLDTISGGSEGDVAIFKIADDARDVVFKHGTDNLDLIDLDVTLDVTEERVQLQKTAAGTWVPFESRP